jgi:squalene-hopene/tetraprenyl-beta-curcumene cyclase
MSASVKAYFALKMVGDDPAAPHMARARAAILARGGAATANVFTCSLLALYGVLPWRSVPVMPVEIMLLPRWFPFHLDKVSYWARTVLVPLLVLMALKPKAKNPRGVTIDELFTRPPQTVGPRPKAPHQKWSWFLVFRGIDAVLRALEPYFPHGPRRRAIAKAAGFVTERLNGEDGLGAIFPAMVNSVLMYDVLGYPARGQAGRGLLPALHVAGVGHRPGLPHPAGGRRRAGHRTGWQGSCMAGAASGAGTEGRLGGPQA